MAARILESYSAIRILGLVFTLALFKLASEDEFVNIFTATALSHYALGLWYSRQRLRNYLRGPGNPQTLIALTILALLCAFTTQPSIIWLFGIHFVFTEVYWIKLPEARGSRERRVLALRLARLGLGSLMYIQAGNLTPLVDYSPYFIALSVVFVAALLWCWKLLGARRAVDLLVFEAMTMITFWFSHSQGVALIWFTFVFYHIAVWWVIPFEKAAMRKLKPAATLIAQTVGIGLVFFLLDKLLYIDGTSRWAALDPISWVSIVAPNNAVGFFGALHILLTPVMSDLNPSWLRISLGSQARDHAAAR